MLQWEGFLGSLSSLLAAMPSSHTYPPLHCQKCFTSDLLPVPHYNTSSRPVMTTVPLLLQWGFFNGMFVMPVNTCITESATAMCPIGELLSNNSPASPRLLCCCRAHRNEERILECGRITSVLSTICRLCHLPGQGNN